MDFEELFNKLREQNLFWRENHPLEPEPLVRAKDMTREIGRGVDNLIAGGMGQASLRGPDALTRQILLNAALLAAGRGAGALAGKGISRVAPKVLSELERLGGWVVPRDIGVHLSKFDDLKNIRYGINTNKGAMDTFEFPLVKNQTYKLSSIDTRGVKMPSNVLAESAGSYSMGVSDNGRGVLNAYVTKSPVGELDPEIAGNFSKYLGVSGNYGYNMRMTPTQKVVDVVKIRPYAIANGGDYLDKLNNLDALTRALKVARAKEALMAGLRGAAVVVPGTAGTYGTLEAGSRYLSAADAWKNRR